MGTQILSSSDDDISVSQRTQFNFRTVAKHQYNAVMLEFLGHRRNEDIYGLFRAIDYRKFRSDFFSHMITICSCHILYCGVILSIVRLTDVIASRGHNQISSAETCVAELVSNVDIHSTLQHNNSSRPADVTNQHIFRRRFPGILVSKLFLANNSSSWPRELLKYLYLVGVMVGWRPHGRQTYMWLFVCLHGYALSQGSGSGLMSASPIVIFRRTTGYRLWPDWSAASAGSLIDDIMFNHYLPRGPNLNHKA